MRIAFVLMSAIALFACESARQSSDFEVGMSREQLVETFGEPHERKTLVKSDASIWGPIETFWSKVPLGSRVEIWSYRVDGGSAELYFVDGATRVQGTGFAADGVIY